MWLVLGVFVMMVLVALAAAALTIAWLNRMDPGYPERRRQRIALDREGHQADRFAQWASRNGQHELAESLDELASQCRRLRDLVPHYSRGSAEEGRIDGSGNATRRT